MSKAYQIRYTETLFGSFTVEADSPEEAEEEFSRLASIGKIDFSDLEVIDSNTVAKEVFDPTGLVDDQDAVFLPGKIHGCEDNLYILSYVENGEGGYWDIKVLDAERILELYNNTEGNATLFWQLLPSYYGGEWYYCDANLPDFKEYADAYPTADFIVNRDGDAADQMLFIVEWARKTISERGV